MSVIDQSDIMKINDTSSPVGRLSRAVSIIPMPEPHMPEQGPPIFVNCVLFQHNTGRQSFRSSLYFVKFTFGAMKSDCSSQKLMMLS